jgi:hypothetical protein
MRLDRDLQAHKFIISNGEGNQLGYIRTCRPMTTLYTMVGKLMGLYRDLKACKCIVSTSKDINKVMLARHANSFYLVLGKSMGFRRDLWACKCQYSMVRKFAWFHRDLWMFLSSISSRYMCFFYFVFNVFNFASIGFFLNNFFHGFIFLFCKSIGGVSCFVVLIK